MNTNFSGSYVFIFFQEEKQEILKHKWLESEKRGYDIGMDRAIISWNLNHKNEWSKNKINYFKNI